jgi:hypothetical protein
MTIKKAVKSAPTTTAEHFIQGAPDAGAVAQDPAGVIRGKKRIITVGIGLDLMPRLDAAAARLSISRAAFINMAIVKTVENTEQS